MNVLTRRAQVPSVKPPRGTTVSSSNTRRRRSPGWVPNQHGAWGMLFSPVVVGVGAAGPNWTQLPLVATWLLGYFAFHAMSLWLKARRRDRYVEPVRAYVSATIVCGLVTLVSDWHLVFWAPLFVGLSGIALWEAAHRRDRSLVSGLATVLAAGAMTYVVMAAAGALDAARATFLVLAQLGYLIGVLLYVKTMIRERNNPRFKALSVGWHALALLCVCLWALTHPRAWVLAAVYAVMLARASLVPGHALRPKQVGMAEMPLHLLVVVAALLA